MSGKQVAWWFIGFFGLIAAVNAAMITAALRTHTGLVTTHPYEKGLAYNRVVEAAEVQDSLGWKGQVAYENGTLRVALRDPQNRLITPEKMTATITRPTQQGMDFTVTLTGAETPVDFPAKGLWEVRVDATHEGVHYQQTARIVVP